MAKVAYITKVDAEDSSLNGMYDYMTHRDGKEPMPIETFRKRKEIIKGLSRKSPAIITDNRASH